MKMNWKKVPSSYSKAITELYQSKVAQARGNKPAALYLNWLDDDTYNYVAIQYLEPGKWERWMIHKPYKDSEISGTWSEMFAMLRPLVEGRAFIEIYPRVDDVVNMSPVRHFWILPEGIQSEFDLR